MKPFSHWSFRSSKKRNGVIKLKELKQVLESQTLLLFIHETIGRKKRSFMELWRKYLGSRKGHLWKNIDVTTLRSNYKSIVSLINIPDDDQTAEMHFQLQQDTQQCIILSASMPTRFTVLYIKCYVYWILFVQVVSCPENTKSKRTYGFCQISFLYSGNMLSLCCKTQVMYKSFTN